MMTGPEHLRHAEASVEEAFGTSWADDPNGVHKIAALLSALISAQQAQTAAFLMFVETRGDYPPYEMDAWREVIPQPPLKECKHKEARRPACAERHTEDCRYADPVPEPKHELLPIGTRVLVSEKATKFLDGRIVYDKQPKVAKIVGYDTFNSKYQLNGEKIGGGYYDFVTWAFADNRVQPHPEQDTAVAEPTGPRMYVRNLRGKQGHIGDGMRIGQGDQREAHVQWHVPGAQPMWVHMDLLRFITPAEVDRCPHGQTGDECGEGENQCELCLADEDAEAEAIEESMGLGDSECSPGCPVIKHRH